MKVLFIREVMTMMMMMMMVVVVVAHVCIKTRKTRPAECLHH